jgi:flagellar basal-body rod protein FlgG
LSIDADRYLCTHDGQRLSDNIQIPEDFEKITIKANGDVEAIVPDDNEPQLLGSIKLAKFINPETLTTLGSGVYITSEDTADPIIDEPGKSGLGELAQHHIENSNVDMVNSLMQLTLAQRIYQINARAMQIADEMEKLTNEIRG